MILDGLHLLLTFQCTFECDHCFVWGSPWQSGTMTLSTIRKILQQANDAQSIEWIYFEGGEPFLYYPTMLAGIEDASHYGFKVGIVTNTYWATSEEDAFLWLRPLAGKVHDLTISSDFFHFSEKVSKQSQIVSSVAQKLEIPVGVICIEQPNINAKSSLGQIEEDTSSIMFRGRAAKNLTNNINLKPSISFSSCPHENLEEPGRLHIDPFGNLHICQGISIGNINHSSLRNICSGYDPDTDPIISQLVIGGPYQLAKNYQLDIASEYADACHLCFETRLLLRDKFPQILVPDQMYGEAF
jgi:hypothetical protein